MKEFNITEPIIKYNFEKVTKNEIKIFHDKKTRRTVKDRSRKKATSDRMREFWRKFKESYK